MQPQDMKSKRFVPRRSSTVDSPAMPLASVRGREIDLGETGWASPLSESSSQEVIETPQLRLERDPGTGRKMINQYLVLQEIGHGTHGRVRLGRDMTESLPDADQIFYAIKIVDRNPKKKKLMGFSRQAGARSDGGKMMNENEIRKEIAIFKKVNHPNVVRMKEIIDDPDSSKLFMILEYCDGGEIQWKRPDGSPALTLSEIRQVFRDTLLGLEYLHHQGIIHRDIKPSNLLLSKEGVVKISDFGCSHYSEALQTAAAHAETERYIDDIELAKTAGSPAFFAPEMCFSGLEPSPSPAEHLPAFIIRPPSVADADDGAVRPFTPTSLQPTPSREPDRRGRSVSPSSIPRAKRLPITNAIDVWALGVTLYCLLFGKTPFDAANEYLLMQVIPRVDYEIPPTMGSEHLPTRTANHPRTGEVRECLDLLGRLLDKDPNSRISLEEAKKHAFTLHGMPDPTTWLASTDPHARTFVTVSNDEVAAVVVHSNSFRDRVRKGMRSISSKLQVLGTVGRSRSRSIGEEERQNSTEGNGHQDTPHQSRLRPSVPSPKVGSPAPTPHSSLSRRLSTLGSREKEMIPDILRRSSLSDTHAHVAGSSQSTSTMVDRKLESSPQRQPSASSFDKMRSPVGDRPERRLSIEREHNRPQSPSLGAGTGMNLGSKLVRLLSRNSSQRSNRRLPEKPSSATLSPHRRSEDRKTSLDDTAVRQSPESSSQSGFQTQLEDLGPREEAYTRSEATRRITPEHARPLDNEDVDWTESLSDDDDDVYEAPSRSVVSFDRGVSWNPDQRYDSFPASPLPTQSHGMTSPADTQRTRAESSVVSIDQDPPRSPDQPKRLQDTFHRTDHAPQLDEDEGLAISTSSRRGRKASVVG